LRGSYRGIPTNTAPRPREVPSPAVDPWRSTRK
jgi:hypothetical protein